MSCLILQVLTFGKDEFCRLLYTSLDTYTNHGFKKPSPPRDNDVTREGMLGALQQRIQ